MAAIDEAWCGECFYTATEIAASSPMFPCDANKGQHVMVVPVSAIAAALDGLAIVTGPSTEYWAGFEIGQGAMKAAARRALLGEEEIYNDK